MTSFSFFVMRARSRISQDIHVSKIPLLHEFFWARILAPRRRCSFLLLSLALSFFLSVHGSFSPLVSYFFSAGALRLTVADSVVIERELHHSGYAFECILVDRSENEDRTNQTQYENLPPVLGIADDIFGSHRHNCHQRFPSQCLASCTLDSIGYVPCRGSPRYSECLFLTRCVAQDPAPPRLRKKHPLPCHLAKPNTEWHARRILYETFRHRNSRIMWPISISMEVEECFDKALLSPNKGTSKPRF